MAVFVVDDWLSYNLKMTNRAEGFVNYLKRMQAVWLGRDALVCWLPPTVFGLVLRFWSLGFGLPNHFRPDEDMVVLPSLGMVGGNLDPHDYTYPTLYKYILVLIYRVCMALGLGAQGYDNAWQYAAYGFFVDGSFFFLVARVVSAVFGVLTIMAIYRVGELAYGRWVGGACAWFLSVSVLHVRDSHFGVTDISSVALLLFGLVYCVHIAQRGALKDYVYAGVFVGLAASAKYGAVLGLVPLCVAHVCCRPEGVPLLSVWIWQRKVWLAGVVCVFTFLLMSPYHVINAAGFVRDFGFQMRHVFEYGHGEDLGSGWMYHPTVTLRYGLGVLVLLGSVGGLVVMGVRRKSVDWVVLSLFVVFFIVIGQGRVVFFRYALPVVPLCCLFCAVLLDRMRGLDVMPKRYVGVVGMGLVCIFMAEPLFASVRLNVMFGKEDTRALARQWVEEHIPEGQLIANVGGLYGDVQIRNRHGVSWWLSRYFDAFGDVPEPELVDFLTQFEDQLPPFYVYNHYIGIRDLSNRSQGVIETLDNEDIAVVVTHEHPLHYSHVAPEFMAVLEKRADLWATFIPAEDKEHLAQTVFNLQDAFYYPLGKFGGLERGGPVVKIWRIKGRDGVAVDKPKASQRLIYDTLFWLGNGDLFREKYDKAITYYERAIRTDPLATDVRLFMAVALMRQNRYPEAADEVREALSLGAEIGNFERAIFFERDTDGKSYAQMGAVCAMVGYYKEAALVYERARSMGYETVDDLNNMGVIYHALGQYEDAAGVLQRALQLDPHHIEAQRNLQVVLQKMDMN
jgi:tetratricopeptide (TPR) repeat protein